MGVASTSTVRTKRVPDPDASWSHTQIVGKPQVIGRNSQLLHYRQLASWTAARPGVGWISGIAC
jgi:hypothetical protein